MPTHQQLIDRIMTYLKNTHRCAILVPECAAVHVSERPDLIGWRYDGISYLIECKTSTADFRRDLKKFSRRDPAHGMGMYRYYFAPKGVIPQDQVPEYWGLLEPHGNTIRTVIRPENMDVLCGRRSIYRQLEETKYLVAATAKGKHVSTHHHRR